VERAIGANCASLIHDGDTLQLGIGAIPDAVLLFLTEKKDLGIHSEMFSDGVVELVEKGVITNTKKKTHVGKFVANFLMGTKRLTLGIQNLAGGISTVPALVGFFGFAEVLSVIYSLGQEQNVLAMEKTKVSLKEVLKHWKLSIYTSTTGWCASWCRWSGGFVYCL